MKFPFLNSMREWPRPVKLEATTPSEGRDGGNRLIPPSSLNSSLVKIAAIFLFGFLIYATNYATWAIRLTLCTLFCSMIYARDNSPYGRWLAIGIIAVGTLLSILLPLAGIGAGLLRRTF